MSGKSHPVLNPFQQQRLLATCQHIDKLLADIETSLTASASRSPFPRLSQDLPAEQRRKLEASVASVRAKLIALLEREGLAPELPSVPVSRAIRSALAYIDVAVEELGPRHMRGYGQLSDAAAAELNAIIGELRPLFSEMERLLSGSGDSGKKERRVS